MHIFAQIYLCIVYICADICIVLEYLTKEADNVAVSKAQQKAVNKYMAENYDRINLTLPKGSKKIIKAHAESKGESMNGFINRAIAETMARE